MQFLVLGYDGEDEKALERRLAVRESHIQLGNKMRDAGKHLYGAAMLDQQGKMKGSMLVCEFDSREELDEWLKEEPYVIGGVWQKIEIHNCKVGPSFVGLKLP